MLFDDVITKHVGEMGRGQVLVLLASSCSWATLALIVLDMVFTTQKPAWTCSNSADAQCAAVLRTGSSFCSLSPEQYAWTAPHSSLVSSFGLVCSDSWKVGLVNAMFFLGYWVGSCVFGWLADADGRKRCLLLSNGTSAAAALLCASSRSYRQYVLWRAVQGFCSAGLPIASYVLSTEAVGPAYRGRAGTASQIVYHAGEWMLPLLAFWLQDWRLLNLAIAAICCVTGALLLTIPESPRWLLLKGRQQEARSALSWLANLNGRQLPADLDITHALELTAAAVTESRVPADVCVAAEFGRLQEGSADASVDGAACRRSPGSVSSSSTLHEQGEAVFSPAVAEACSAGMPAAPLAAGPTSSSSSSRNWLRGSSDADEESTLLDNDCTALLAMGAAAAAMPAKPNQQQKQQSPGQQSISMLSLFSHALLARYFVVASLLCTVMAICFYTISLATASLQGSLYANFFLTSVGEVPAALIAGAAIDTIGRRITVGTGVLLTGLACCACSLLPPGWLTIALASAGKACCSGTWTISYIYAAEIFPTYIRSVALAGTNQASRLGGVIAPGILYASEQLGLPAAAPFAAVGVAALLTAALLGMLPETMGQPQPDSVADLERLYGKQCSSSSNSTEAQHAGIWWRVKAQCCAAGAAGLDYHNAGAAGKQEGGWAEQCVGRQGSKLQRLLCRMSSSGSIGAHSSGGGWAIPANWRRSSSNGGGSGGGAGWLAVSTEEDSLRRQQQLQQHSQAPSVPEAASCCQAEEAAVKSKSSDMEMGMVASDASRQ